MESGIDEVAFDSTSSEACDNMFSAEWKPVDHKIFRQFSSGLATKKIQ